MMIKVEISLDDIEFSDVFLKDIEMDLPFVPPIGTELLIDANSIMERLDIKTRSDRENRGLLPINDDHFKVEVKRVQLYIIPPNDFSVRLFVRLKNENQ